MGDGMELFTFLGFLLVIFLIWLVSTHPAILLWLGTHFGFVLFPLLIIIVCLGPFIFFTR